ncbi:MAG TPA: hypothetical protein VGO92_03615 [Acidimicrobiales bacterium]|nr:hypothetical protein [Acidimicrobiales bacterium]
MIPRALADPALGGFMSSNVHWVAHLPIDSPGVGGRVVHVGDQVRFYVTGAKGLTIYDVTNPAQPAVLGIAALPHFENEDVAVSADGNWVFVAHDANFQLLDNAYAFTYVIDARNVTLPLLASRIPYGTHIASCADDDCNYLYGSEGWTFDLRDKANPVQVVPGWVSYLNGQGAALRTSALHDVNRDDAGYFITDSTPRVMFDPRPDATKPRLLATGPVPKAMNLAYQHNNQRIRADEWHPRLTAEDDADPALRPGEIMLSNGETNEKPRCDAGAGPFATWSVRDWDRGTPMKPLDVFRPVSGTYSDGNPAVNALGCSGHWFTYRNGLVAAGWYEHGTRFLDVDQATGKITEVGYFQPVNGSTSAAHWVNDDYVYTVDYSRGIDVLHFDRSAAPAPQVSLNASWLRPVTQATSANQVAAAERWHCKLAQQRGATAP